MFNDPIEYKASVHHFAQKILISAAQWKAAIIEEAATSNRGSNRKLTLFPGLYAIVGTNIKPYFCLLHVMSN